eukprot:GILI01015997.1.p1 GENE.GILI01015997.1~~GILI01015997.1.p1  ORF type:complete len:290 (-),score=29.67 GILI01015997.1:79-906(-)
MLDLWESLTGHLFSLYEKRKIELLEESANKLNGRAQQKYIRNTWTHNAVHHPRSKPLDETIEGIQKRTQEILEKGAAASEARKRAAADGSIYQGDDERNPYNGVSKGYYLREALGESQPVEEEPPSLVQKIGLSVEHKKKVLSETAAANEMYREQVAKSASGTDEKNSEATVPPSGVPSIDWSSIQKQVAEELDAKYKRDAERYSSQRAFAIEIELERLKIEAKESTVRSQQVAEFDYPRAVAQTVSAQSASANVLAANTTFELMNTRSFAKTAD